MGEYQNTDSTPYYQDGEEVEEAEEEQQEAYEEGVDAGAEGDLMGFSEPKQLGGLYALFSDVLDRTNSIKVSNVNKWELGDLGITVRDAMRIALIGKTFHHPIFAQFFLNQAGIVTDSSMSKEGWFTELFVTSKKQAYKSTSSSIGSLPQSKNKWGKIFTNQKETARQ